MVVEVGAEGGGGVNEKPWGWPWTGLLAIAVLYLVFWLSVAEREKE